LTAPGPRLVSQATRQGIAVLMASAVVMLKQETSTLSQSHNFISIDFKYGVGDYVTEVTSPDYLLAPENGGGNGNIRRDQEHFAFTAL